MGKMREFDLNIERVLENWTVAHALREVIANALDEQTLTGTREPQIFQDAGGRWHVRDWGRGLRYEHLTQNENKEKLAQPDKVVGKFGVGLKDALATFDRHRVDVLIRSRYGDITTGKQAKHGFADIKTLHALITDPVDPGFTGTEYILAGTALGERQVEEAKTGSGSPRKTPSCSPTTSPRLLRRCVAPLTGNAATSAAARTPSA
jgi:hypothetical protein